MNTSDTPTWVIAILVLLVLAVVVWLLTRQRQSKHLEQRFGPEYSRLVAERGDRTKAEAELLERERRVRRLKIVPLEPDDAARFSGSWDALQGRFVDEPRSAVADADRLVRELMVKRGYPMADFERRAEDISDNHPGARAELSSRAGDCIAERARRGKHRGAAQSGRLLPRFVRRAARDPREPT